MQHVYWLKEILSGESIYEFHEVIHSSILPSNLACTIRRPVLHFLIKKWHCPETLSLLINDSCFIFHSIVEVEFVLLISREHKWSYTFSCDIRGSEANLHLYILPCQLS